jgi:HSP20 family protein
LQRHLDEVFDRLVFRPWAVPSRPCWTPAADVHETADAYLIEFDLPGVSPEDLQITVGDRALTLRGQRTTEIPEGTLHNRCERPSGPFQRCLTLAQPILAQQARAEYRDGVCRIFLPKAPAPEAASSCVIRLSTS